METFGSTFLLLLCTVTFLLSGTHCSTYVRVPDILHGTHGKSLLLSVENLIRAEDADMYFSWNFHRKTLVVFRNQKDINMDESRFSFQPPNASLLIHRLDHTVEGEYILAFYIKFPNGSKVTEHKSVHVTVDVPVSLPVIKRTPASELVEDKDDVTWMCSVENGTRVRYQWFRDFRPIHAMARYTLSPNNNTLVIRPVQKEDIGEYSCVAENFISQKSSEPMALNMFYGPYNLAVKSDQGLQTGGVFTVNPGELVFFDCLADSNPPNSCAWISKTNNATQVLMIGSRFEVSPAYKLAYTEEFVCRAFNNVTQKQDETEFTLVVASLGTGKEKHSQEGSGASSLTAIAVISLIIIICMLAVLFRKSCHPHRVIMNIYNRPLTDQKSPHLSGHEDATEDFGIYEFVAIPGRAESTLASNRSLAGLESAQDLHTTIYDVIKHIPETPAHSLLM